MTAATSVIRRRPFVRLWSVLLATGLVFVASTSSAQQPEPTAAESVPVAADSTLPAPGRGETIPAQPAAEESEPHASEAGSDSSSVPPSAGPPVDPWPERTEWAHRVVLLAEAIEQGISSSESADELFAELAPDLRAEHRVVLEALRQRSPDALEQREKANGMYAARLRLFDLVSPSMRAALLGAGSTGIRELRLEFEHAKLDFLFQTLAIPRGLLEIADGFRESPLDDVWRLLELLFGVVVFRSWRRWARRGLPEARRKVLAVRPSTDMQMQVARGLWYLDRFRGPLEWLALLYYAAAIYEPGNLEEVASLVWIVLLWTLLTRFGFLLVDALASRGATGRSSRVPGLRLRSLRLVAAWILLAGLGLDLTSSYVGEAAIHTWASRCFFLLLAPLGFVLLHWWRPEIHRRVSEIESFPEIARRIGDHRKGLRSYVSAVVGLLYVIAAEGLQLFIRVASRFEAGRKMVATLLRREIERDADRERPADKPISPELAFELLTADGTVIDAPYREALDELKQVVQTDRGAIVGVLAERGGGLRTFLGLLEDEIGESMRIVDCPPGGPEKFSEALAESFGLSGVEELEEQLRPRMDAAGVRIVAINNFHRVARPKLGGLVGLDRAAEVSSFAGPGIVWIVTLTRAAWPYMSRLMGDRAILQRVFELPSWTEDQLAELVDARCKKAGIEPDYRRLVFPRQFDDGEGATLEERNRFGFHRVLWELSDGNPEVAIRLFTDSLRESPGGGIVVRLPNPAPTAQIAASNLTTMLILKVLVETELATVEDLVEAIREPHQSVSNALAVCVQEGWVEEIYDHYQVTWAAYRRVKRVLIRRGLIAR